MPTKTNYLRVVAMVAAAALAASLLAVIAAAQPSQATLQGAQGKIAFASDRAGNLDIWVMNANGKGPVQLTNDPLPEVLPAWSPDGQKIAFMRLLVPGDRRSTEIFVMNADGTEQKRLTTSELGDGTPTWSPDGTKIAFVSRRDGGNAEIYVMEAEDKDGDGNGDNPTNLTNDPAFDFDPDWSPDGKRIAFSSDRSAVSPSEQLAVYTMRSNGTDLRQLTDLSLNAFGPTWSPEGDKLAFSDEGCIECAESDLFVMKANGKGVAQITDTPEDETGASENETGATWSPDGERIAFENFRLQRVTDPDTGETHLDFVPGSGEIYVIGEDGGGRKNLTNNPDADDEHPDWSPEQAD